jgi:hypothetical protein
MSRDLGPPERERPGATASDRVNPEVRKPPSQPHSAVKPNVGPRRCGRHADTFRWGFGCGFRDALRLAARRLPPETWDALDGLADEYDLAGEP